MAQNRAGVTRHLRWLTLADGVEVLDTPGVLAPRSSGRDSGWQLALCGSLPDAAFDAEDVVARLHAWLSVHRAAHAKLADLESFARSHGMRRRGGELDLPRAARQFIASFRAGRVLRLTFERPESGE